MNALLRDQRCSYLCAIPSMNSFARIYLSTPERTSEYFQLLFIIFEILLYCIILLIKYLLILVFLLTLLTL